MTKETLIWYFVLVVGILVSSYILVNIQLFRNRSNSYMISKIQDWSSFWIVSGLSFILGAETYKYMYRTYEIESIILNVAMICGVTFCLFSSFLLIFGISYNKEKGKL